MGFWKHDARGDDAALELVGHEHRSRRRARCRCASLRPGHGQPIEQPVPLSTSSPTDLGPAALRSPTWTAQRRVAGARPGSGFQPGARGRRQRVRPARRGGAAASRPSSACRRASAPARRALSATPPVIAICGCSRAGGSLVVGGGQSAFESAVLMHERGAARGRDPRASDRRSCGCADTASRRRIGRLGPIVYAPTDVGPLWYSRLVEKPDLLFRHLPRDVQNRIAARSIRPACSNFVRVRLDGVRISTGCRSRPPRRVDRRPAADALRRQHARGRPPDVRDRLPRRRRPLPLPRRAPARAAPSRRRLPRPRPGLESSVAGLHFVGAPAAWSFGPIMRFVSGSWYGGQRRRARIAGRRPAASRPPSGP